MAGAAGSGVRLAVFRGWIIIGYALTGVLLLALLVLVPSSARDVLPDRGVTATAVPGAVAPAPSLRAPAARAVASSPAPAVAQGSPPLHIIYPAVGMDQDVLPLAPEEKSARSMVPPETLDAYWLTPYGSPGPGSTNTTYIVGHSWEDRGSAFNNLSTRARVGDRLSLTTAHGILTYTVNEITTENKDTLKDSGIWAKVPGRLILVSCYTADIWGQNIIIEATPEMASDGPALPGSRLTPE